MAWEVHWPTVAMLVTDAMVVLAVGLFVIHKAASWARGRWSQTQVCAGCDVQHEVAPVFDGTHDVLSEDVSSHHAEHEAPKTAVYKKYKHAKSLEGVKMMGIGTVTDVLRRMEDTKWKYYMKPQEDAKPKEDEMVKESVKPKEIVKLKENVKVKENVKLKEDLKMKENMEFQDPVEPQVELDVQEVLTMFRRRKLKENAKLKENVKVRHEAVPDMWRGKREGATMPETEADLTGSTDDYDSEELAEDTDGVYEMAVNQEVLTVQSMPHDGDSLFSALVHQTYSILPGEPQHEMVVAMLRKDAADHLRANMQEYWEDLLLDVDSYYGRYADEATEEAMVLRYLEDVSTRGFPPGTAAIQALADSKGFHVMVYSTDELAGDEVFWSKQQAATHTNIVVRHLVRGRDGSAAYHFDSVLEAAPAGQRVDETMS